MEEIKKFIMNLSSILVFITAVEIIAPDNNMKKYIKFVLGLILIAFMINPIVYFASNGENIVTNKIEEFSENVSAKTDKKQSSSSDNKLMENNFKNKFENNLEIVLSKQFKNSTFECVLEGGVDFDIMKFNTDKLYIYVDEAYDKNTGDIKEIEKVKKVEDINTNKEKTAEKNDKYLLEIKSFIAENVQVDEDKIVISYK